MVRHLKDTHKRIRVLLANGKECGDIRFAKTKRNKPLRKKPALDENLFQPDPLVVLEVRNGNRSTKLLITRFDAYCYCVYANGSWRFFDNERVVFSNATQVAGSISYMFGVNTYYVGPKAINDAINHLNSADASRYEFAMKTLVINFIEAARLKPIQKFVADSFTHFLGRYYQVKITGEHRAFINNWKSVSTKFKEYALRMRSFVGPIHKDDVVLVGLLARKLGLSTITEVVGLLGLVG